MVFLSITDILEFQLNFPFEEILSMEYLILFLSLSDRIEFIEKINTYHFIYITIMIMI
jgi:hypothetical protein